jgi:hypothetical protein
MNVLFNPSFFIPTGECDHNHIEAPLGLKIILFIGFMAFAIAIVVSEKSKP